jgi:hypothetical protein
MLVNITVTVHLTSSENIAEFSEILDLTLCHGNQEKQQKVMASSGPYHSTYSRWYHCNKNNNRLYHSLFATNDRKSS